MVSSKIANLSDSDLMYLEKVLGKEFARQNEYSSQFKSKNGYVNQNSNESKQILRLMSAIRSQRRVARLEKW
jgi:tRNA A-37 threonylcarbamoyl transferase component Bud32